MIMSQLTTTLLYYDDQYGLFRCQQPQIAMYIEAVKRLKFKHYLLVWPKLFYAVALKPKFQTNYHIYSGQVLHYNAG